MYEIIGKNQIGFPKIEWFGLEGEFYCLVMQALGPSLEDLFQYCG